MQFIAIGALERSIKSFARSLEKRLGATTEVETYRSGRGNDELGPSYVELTVDVEDFSVWVKFYAGGYSGHHDREFAPLDGLRPMQQRALDYILKELRQQGWKG